MDPLDIMLDLENVTPYYKPMVRADNQQIAGYEVIPYFNHETSLEWFFEDASIPDDFQFELTNHIQQKAIETFIQTDQSFHLFFKYSAKLLVKDNGESLLSLLDFYAEKVKLNRIFISIKEIDIQSSNKLRQLFNYMKTLGIGVIIDVGRKNVNLERLALLKPTIIKIDTSFLESDLLPNLYRDVHHSIAMLSRKIGASLLFKNISTFQQLNYAWRNGGEYYQGPYLKREGPSYVEADSCTEKMNEDFQHFIQFERKNVKAQLMFTNQISNQFEKIFHKVNPDQSYDDLILQIGQECSPFAFRVYICNEEGLQLSSNAEKTPNKQWELKYEGKHKNWSWRPYFFENIIRMNMEKKGLLSDLYTDIERNEQIRTYAYPFSEMLYVFLDIPYDYLYEQEGLL